MSWEDDELRAFERLKQTRERNDDLILSRSKLRDAQAASRWIELRGKLISLVITFNDKAARTVMNQTSAPAEYLRIMREDGVYLEVEFIPDLYRVEFVYPDHPGHNCTYELRVMPFQGNDTTVWIDQKTKDKETVDVIAASAIRILLRCVL